ncbi:MAG: thiol:disulfide interchange protein DsbD [Silanimonas sp.]|nr:MAG: thiol:disulfide interchange protein DsbD [Silanimonas sp.]
MALLLFALPALAAKAGAIPPEVDADPRLVATQHARVALLADHAAVAPGQRFHAGLRIVHAPGWHTYWLNPGDSGLPTRYDWILPEGATASDIRWPMPERKPIGELTNFGYEGVLLLPAELSVPPQAAPGERFRARLRARWLICEEICIPDEATLELDLPVEAQARPSADSPAFAAALAAVPQTEPGWRGVTRRDAEGITVEVQGCSVALDGAERIEVFPVTPQIVANHRIEAAHDAAGVLRFHHPASEYYAGMPATVDWVLVREDGETRRAFAVSLRGEDALASTADAAGTVPAAPRLGLGMALLFALLGGLILNLMPCVFPVLALKALAFQHGETREHRRHALLYTAGVLVSFLLLAGLLMALRAAGEALGWGFQLQTPWFVAAMALLMAAVGFALSGLATPGAALMGLGQSLTEGSGGRAAFFTGVLAVVVASPCTAPFMGPALGFALTQPAAQTLLVFTALGLGLALPLLLVGFVPALASCLPRPGAWMERLKQALAFPMYLTALWLAWVLGRQVGVDGMALLLAGMLLMGFALWWRGAQPGRLRRLAVAALLLLALAPVLLIAQRAPSVRGAGGTASVESPLWQPWSPEAVAALRAEGRPVLVNFTAAWCITCLANERVALSGTAFEAALREHGIAYLKADWTDYDARITAALAEFGRSGVPLYVVYPAGGGEPVLLPQVLTPDTVSQALREAARHGSPPSTPDGDPA